MPRRKAAKNCNILPWLSRRRDNTEGRFLQVGNSMFLSVKDKETGAELNPYVKLPDGAKNLYQCMSLEAGGHKSFEFTRITAENKYGIQNSNLRRNVEVLIKAGFIRRNSGKTVRQPNHYEFIFEWKPKD